MGSEAGLDVSWRDADYLAVGLQRHPEIRARFPTLQVNEVSERLGRLEEVVSGAPSESVAPYEHSAIERAPRTPEEERTVIETQPPGWEYLLFAGALLQGREQLAAKWHDREFKLGRGPTCGLDHDEAREVLKRSFGPLRLAVDRVGRILEPDAQEKAFGKPGESGDVNRIKHLASTLISGYEELLDRQAELRSCAPPDEWEDVYRLAAEFPDALLSQIHDFIGELVEHVDAIPAYFASPEEEREPMVIELTLNVALRDGLERQFSRALKKLQRRVYR